MSSRGRSGRLSGGVLLALSLAALVAVGIVSFVLEGGGPSAPPPAPGAPGEQAAAPPARPAPPPPPATPPPTYVTNSAGFRDDHDYPVAKPDGVVRVIFVGDSMTFGYGVSIEDGLVRQADKDLQASPPPGGKRWEVLNMGQLALNITAELNLIRARVVEFAPDVLVLMYHLNDALSAQPSDLGDAQTTTRLISEYVLATLGSDDRKKVQAWLEQNGADMAALQPGKYDLRGLQLFAEYRVSHYTPLYWNAALESFDELAALGKEHGFRIVAGIIPAIDFTWDQYAFRDIHQKVAKAMRARGFTVVDLLPVLSKQPNVEMMQGGVDGHPSVAANALIAEAMAAAVAKAVK